MKKILLATFLGALTAYLWSVISYTVLPWHNLDFASFRDDTKIRQELVAQSPKDGIYTIPNMPVDMNDTAANEKWMQDSASGPFAYMWVIKNGLSFGMGTSLVIQFITQLAVVLIAIWLLLQSSISGYIQRSIFIALIVLAGSLLSFTPQWSWYGFPIVSTIVNIVDNTFSYFLAGLVIARFIRPGIQEGT